MTIGTILLLKALGGLLIGLSNKGTLNTFLMMLVGVVLIQLG